MANVENQELEALKQDMEQRGIQPTDSTLARTVQEQEIAGLQTAPPRRQPALTQNTSFRASTTALVQNTLDEADRKQIACCAIYILLVISSPAIAAVIIAAQFDKNTSSCYADGQQYLIDLDDYLYVAGGVQLGIFVIFSFSQIFALLFCGEDGWLKIRKALTNPISHCISLTYPLFHIAWACIGIYIYTEEMSNECKEEDIGIMILSWVVIEFVVVFGLICCCGCCLFFGVAAALMTSSVESN